MKSLADFVSAYRHALGVAVEKESPAADAAHERAMVALIDAVLEAYPTPKDDEPAARPPRKPREAWKTSAQQERDAAAKPAPAPAPPRAELAAVPAEGRGLTVKEGLLAILREDGAAWTAGELLDQLTRLGTVKAKLRGAVVCGALAKLEGEDGLVKREQLAVARNGARFEWRAVVGAPVP